MPSFFQRNIQPIVNGFTYEALCQAARNNSPDAVKLYLSAKPIKKRFFEIIFDREEFSVWGPEAKSAFFESYSPLEIFSYVVTSPTAMAITAAAITIPTLLLSGFIGLIAGGVGSALVVGLILAATLSLGALGASFLAGYFLDEANQNNNNGQKLGLA